MIGRSGKFSLFLRTSVLACLVGILSYLAACLGGALMLRPKMIWALWPGCAFLVAVLLLSPRRRWPVLIVVGLAGFVVYDLQIGIPVPTIALFILADAIEVLVAALTVSYAFNGVPRLDSIRSLATYFLFAVVIAPALAGLVGAIALGGNFWTSWRLSFFIEGPALMTVTPAILSWGDEVLSRRKRPSAYYLEGIALITGLFVLADVVFVLSPGAPHPALLYSLVPFLLWAALRFGTMGASTAMLVIAFLSIWGAIHGRGPFTEGEPLERVQSLQLFLLFSTTSFLTLSALVEENKEALRRLRESEKRFRLVANTAPVLIWMSGPDKRCTYFNKSWLDFTGRSMDEELGDGWAEGVHPEDRERCVATYSRAFDLREKFRMEYRLRRSDGEYRWVVDIGEPRFNPDNSFAGYIGIGIDITDRKAAEEALSGVSRKLIEAQEQERRRIARDLHDDISQRLVLLAIQHEELQKNAHDNEVRSRMRELRKQVMEISTTVHALSHELHSSKLEYLGIAAAARSFCKELAERQNVQIEFSIHDLPDCLPSDLSLCLFRVLQEALHNAVKHSGVKLFTVRLWRTPEEIHLTVADSGSGFDTQAAMQRGGLGLTSMQERLRSVNGKFSVESQPQHGTEIHASVPFVRMSDSMRAAG